MNAIADGIDAEATHLMIYDSTRQMEILGEFERGDPGSIAVYLRDYLPIDPRVSLRLRTERGAVIADREIWAPEERLASPVYQDFQMKNRLHDITGAHMSMGDIFIWYGVAKGSPGVFSQDERDRLQVLMPHIRQSLRLHLEISQRGAQRDWLGQLWSESGKAVLLVDALGKIRYCNALAEQLIRDGVARRRDGQLAFLDARAQATLGRELQRMRGKMPDLADVGADAFGSSCLVFNPINCAQYGVRVMRLLNDGATTDSLLVTLTPLDLAENFTADELARFGTMFGLTTAEQRVVRDLAGGIDLETFARGRQIKVDTARKQLKSALAKIGCRSQKDLLRLIERFCFLQTR